MTQALLLSLVSACFDSNTEPPKLPVADADIVIAADLNGDNNDDLISIKGEQVSWHNESHELSGTVQTYRVGAISDGPKEIVLLATGRSRTNPRATPQIVRIDEQGFTPIYIGDQISERISDLRMGPDGLYVTRIRQGKTAEGAWLRADVFETQTTSVMGLQQFPLSDGRYVVGRLYGDKAREFGGLEIHESGQAPIRLPVFRGVRTIEPYDLNQDGHLDLVVADGWHYRYGDEGRARLLTFLGPTFEDRRVLAELDGSYTINRIEFVDTAANTPPKILAHASHGTFLLHPDILSWRVETLSAPAARRSIVAASNGRGRWLLGADEPARALQTP